MLNTITIHGRLTADPELNQTQSGVSVCSFTVAVDRSYTKPGEDKISDFFTVKCWRGLADMVSKYFAKGKEILVNGEMQSRKWHDNDGNNRISWEILANSIDFCGSKEKTSTTTANTTQADFEPIEDNSDEDLPF